MRYEQRLKAMKALQKAYKAQGHFNSLEYENYILDTLAKHLFTVAAPSDPRSYEYPLYIIKSENNLWPNPGIVVPCSEAFRAKRLNRTVHKDQCPNLKEPKMKSGPNMNYD